MDVARSDGGARARSGRPTRRTARAAAAGAAARRPTGQVTAKPARASSTIVGPGATVRRSDANAESTRPPTDADRAEHHRGASVARNDRVSCWAVATGTTISAQTSSRPDGAHRDGDGDRGEHRDQQVVDAHVAARRPGRTPGPGRPRTAGARARRTRATTTAASAMVTQTSVDGDGGDRAEEVLLEPRRALAGQAGEQHAAGDAAVEQQRQRDVAVGVAALADHLDQHRAEDRDDHGGPGRRGAGQQPEGDAGDGDVADAVAHQGQPALHQVGADRRRGQPGEERGEQRPLHERRR